MSKIIKSATKKQDNNTLKNRKNLKIHTHATSNPNKFISLV